MKVKCDNCKEVIPFVPSLDDLREEIKELVLDRVTSSTDDEMSAYIDQLYACVTNGIQDSVAYSKANLHIKQRMARERFQ
jgi:hypothetical protein